MALSDLFYLDAEGLHISDYEAILEFYTNEYKRIYGDDVYLDPDSQDGQWVAVQALAIYDTQQTSAAVYSSYSPSTSVGDGLTRNVKINGLHRAIPTKSTVDLKCIGTNGTSIVNGYAKDTLNRKWFLPSPTNIVSGGEVTVTATAEFEGALEAIIGSVNIIGTPQKGWLSVDNEAAAAVGDPVEDDPDLRLRQSISTMIPSQSITEGVAASIAALDGVTKYTAHENDTGSPDSDGVTAHTLAMIVEGGDADEIAEVIFNKKSVGCNTEGSISVTDVKDIEGHNNTINFYRPDEVPIEVVILADEVLGYLDTTDDLIKQAVADYINALGIGGNVYYTKLYTPANLPALPEGNTFNITSITIDTVAGGSPTENDLVIAFNELATSDVANITVTVTPL
jgi:uncharacterized phage protein gp47/JayE